jgi:MFS family permease
LNYVDRQAVFSIFPVLRKELGFTSAELGLIGTLFLWLYALCMPLAGYLADNLRRERLVVGSMVLWSVALIGTSRCHSPLTFLAWQAALGVAESVYYPSAIGMIAVWHPGPTRSRALGVHQSAQMVGVVAGGWFGGWAASQFGWRNGFAGLGLVGLIYSACLAVAFQALKAPREESRPADPRRFEIRWPRATLYWLLTVAFALCCGMLWIAYAWLPNTLYERFHLSLASSGFHATVFIQTCSVVGVVGGAWVADRLARSINLGRLLISAAGILLSAPFAYLMFAAPSIPQFHVYAALFGLLNGLNVGNFLAAAYDTLPDRNYSFAGGLINMAGGVVAGVTVGLAGRLKDSLGINAVMAAAAGITSLAAAVLLLAASRRVRRRT